MALVFIKNFIYISPVQEMVIPGAYTWGFQRMEGLLGQTGTLLDRNRASIKEIGALHSQRCPLSTARLRLSDEASGRSKNG